MKYLIFIGLFAAGGITGYIVGVNKTTTPISNVPVETELITEFIYDTIIEHETIEIPVYKEKTDTIIEVVDTLIEVFELDTLKETIKPKDTSKTEEKMSIKSDEMLLAKRIPIVYLEEIIEKDSLIKNLLGINAHLAQDMNVQFWRSPLNYLGYKFSKNTLILYGLSPQFNYTVYHKNNTFYLSNETVFYTLIETQDFLPYSEIEKSEILND